MTDGSWALERRLLTIGLIALVTAAAFEGMAVPTVLPALAGELEGLDLYGWAFSAFWLTNIIGITVAGSETDRKGPAGPFIVGSLLFAAGLVIAGVATQMPLVIAGRAIQGFGSGAIGSVVYAVVARAYPPLTRPRMIALISSAWVLPGLIGPALAGTVTDTIGWRWVFLGVAPLVLVTAAALWRPLARIGTSRTEAPERGDLRRALDAAALAAGSAVFLTALSVGQPIAAVLLAIAGLGLAAVGLIPLVPAGTLRLAPGRPSVVAAIFAIGFAFFGTEAFVPLAVVEVRGESVTMGGLALSAAAVTWAASSWFQARAAASGIRRSLVTGGASLLVVGIGITSAVLLPNAPVLVAAVGWTVAGLGMGLAYSMLTLLVLETATPGEEGFSSSALALMFTLGTALGAGVGGAVVASAEGGALALDAALLVVNMIMAAAAIGAVAIGWRVPRSGAASAGRPDLASAGLPLEHPG